MEQRKVAFIGAGNMTRSIVAGLVASGYEPNCITATNRSEAKLTALQQDYGVQVTTDNVEAAKQADVIVMAVKPQLMEEVAKPLQSVDFSNKLVISIAAGINVARMQQMFACELNLIRVMPNTPSLVGKGMSGLFASPVTPDADKQFAGQLMQAVGKVCWVEQESGINDVIAAAGSAPAYFFLFMEAIQQQAIASGFDSDSARLLVQQTALGAATMVTENPDIDLATLRQQVTSKGGTTAEAVRTFEESDIRGIVAKAMQAAVARAEEMEKLF
ncbi:pyrroline-5-carboxylate reductase [Vibrio sp. 10N]|uniref:pyrroline-5-carboxylate reductase n=1 Tax=Vibrio sp. 10N TaxID=3058938 RepID=UPI002814529E|nr:pyrroline-5-carboxylate reductase [Vibrio sp. 10N]